MAQMDISLTSLVFILVGKILQAPIRDFIICLLNLWTIKQPILSFFGQMEVQAVLQCSDGHKNMDHLSTKTDNQMALQKIHIHGIEMLVFYTLINQLVWDFLTAMTTKQWINLLCQLTALLMTTPLLLITLILWCNGLNVIQVSNKMICTYPVRVMEASIFLF